MKIDKTLLSDLLLLAVTLLAAGGWIFSKEALQGIAPLSFLGIRFFMAGVLLMVMCTPQLKRMTAAHWRTTLGMGLLFSVALMLWVNGLFLSDHVGEGAFITSLGVVLVPVVAKLVFKDTPEGSTWLALPAAIVGLACLSLNNGFRFETSQLLFIVAAIMFAVHFNLISRALIQVPAFALTSIQLTFVGLSATGVAMFVEPWPPQISDYTWGWILASVLLASSARFLIQAYAQSMASASHAAIIMVLEPLWASLMAIYWFGESMTAQQMLGCTFIFLALLLNRWRSVRQLLKSLLR
ncbi:MAG: DMT family transporter [Ketobacter sp.]|nr:DMT family transporter [Ketobacter sp.]